MNSIHRTIYLTRVYKQRIKKTHPLYKTFIELTIKSKNLYNLALYEERQYYFEHKKIIPRFTLISMLNKTQAYKELPSQTSNLVADQAYLAFKAFNEATKEFYKNPSKFLGRPRIPRYKDKLKGRNTVSFTYQQLRIKDSTLLLPKGSET